MGLTTEAKRAKYGQNLLDLQGQASRMVNNMVQIFSNLNAQKAEMEADSIFTADDIAEVDSIRLALAEAIATAILAGDEDVKANIVSKLTA